MTLKEIAKEAGVSISTVSRVVNKNIPGAASKEIQDRIWEIVRKTGYTPNASARNLKMGENSSIFPPTKAIACLFGKTDDTSSDQFFSSLARSIEQEAFKHNYIVKYSFSSIDATHPNTYRLICDNGVDGVIILGKCDKLMLKMLKQHFRNVAYTGVNSIDADYDQITCNGKSAAITAINHLIGLGHKKIGYIGETIEETRFDGYCEALSEHHITFTNSYIVDVPRSSEGGYLGTKKLLEKNSSITAIFCCNDITAIGAMRAIREFNLSIPNDISLISIDDIDTAQYLNPMLSTIHIPIEEMGQMTAKTLIDRIEGGHKLPLKMELPYYLATRDSCGLPKHN